MELKENTSWWLSIITIPALSFVLWIIHNKFHTISISLLGKSKRLTILKVVLFIVILNFGVWGIGTIALHGEAVSGKKENNRYFLKWKMKYTQEKHPLTNM